MRNLPLALALATLLSGPALADTAPTTEPSNTSSVPAMALTQAEVEGRIASAGFTEFRLLSFKNGIWKADARGGEKEWVDVYVHPITGKVFREGKPSPLNAQDIEAKVTAAGYQDVHDVDFKGGIWKAEADNGKGDEVNLLVDPDDGSVISEAND
ncbi:MAG TPA: PepSY domain-containing protein [Dokdonella sp.]|jgi:hypothetical protein|nr:PepSY domain-containing protein [Dokdonella sp.]